MIPEDAQDRQRWDHAVRKARKSGPEYWADFQFYVGTDGTLKERIRRASSFESMCLMERLAAQQVAA